MILLLGCTSLIEGNIEKSYDTWSVSETAPGKVLVLALKLLCLRKSGRDDKEEIAQIQKILPTLTGFQKTCVPLMKYLTGSLNRAQFDKNLKAATNPDLLSRYYTVLGVEAQFKGQFEEARKQYNLSIKTKATETLLRMIPRLLLERLKKP